MTVVKLLPNFLFVLTNQDWLYHQDTSLHEENRRLLRKQLVFFSQYKSTFSSLILSCVQWSQVCYLVCLIVEIMLTRIPKEEYVGKIDSKA